MNTTNLKKVALCAGFVLGLALSVSSNAKGVSAGADHADPETADVNKSFTAEQTLDLMRLVKKEIQDSDTLRETVDDKVEKSEGRIKAEVSDLKKDAEKLLDAAKWWIGTTYVFLLAIIGIQVVSVRSRVQSEIASQTEDTKKNIETASLKTLMEHKKTLLKELGLQRRLIHLNRAMVDISEPSMRHPLPYMAEMQLKELIDSIKAMEGMDKAWLTAPDAELQGDAYHYLAGPADSVKRKSYESEAISCYRKALEKLGGNQWSFERLEQMRCTPESIRNYRKLANAYAGHNEYDKAIKLYKSIITSPAGKEDAQTWHSWGDALKNSGDHKEAYRMYWQAMKISEKNTKSPKSIYWESRYQKGNSLSALGAYDETIKCYEEIEEQIKHNSHDFKYFTWLFHSMGDAYRNRGDKGGIDNAIKHYVKELRFVSTEDDFLSKNKRLGKTYYKLARSILDLEQYSRALKFYEKALRFYGKTNPSCQPQENIESDMRLVFNASYGYALAQTNKEIGRKMLSNAIREAKELHEKNKTNAGYKHVLAACYAFADKSDKALTLLKELMEENRRNPSKERWVTWVKEADYSNFVTIKPEVRKIVEDTEKSLRPSIEEEIHKLIEQTEKYPPASKQA